MQPSKQHIILGTEDLRAGIARQNSVYNDLTEAQVRLALPDLSQHFKDLLNSLGIAHTGPNVLHHRPPLVMNHCETKAERRSGACGCSSEFTILGEQPVSY
nr:hypothetical protein [Pirellula staleyi]